MLSKGDWFYYNERVYRVTDINWYSKYYYVEQTFDAEHWSVVRPTPIVDLSAKVHRITPLKEGI